MLRMAEHGQRRVSASARAYGTLKLAVCLLLLAWLARWTYVRVTIRPPGGPSVDPLTAVPKTARAAEISAKLTEAIRSLPAAGYGPFWASFANRGEWDPAARRPLADVIRYLERPEIARALDAVSRFARTCNGADAPVVRGDLIHTAANLLLARARYFWEGQDQYDAAIADLVTILHLGCCTPDPSPHSPLFLPLFLRGWQPAACAEARFLATGGRGSADALAALQAGIASAGVSDASALWNVLRGEIAQIRSRLDDFYTRDSEGNGWLDLECLCLAESDPQYRVDLDKLTRAGGLWNVLSPLFHSRDAVEHSTDWLFTPFHDLAGLRGSPLFARLAEYQQRLAELDALDPPMSGLVRSSALLRGTSASLTALVHAIMARDATLAVIAIERYRREHDGALPPSLQVLVPAYLPSPPFDWYADAPMRYLPSDDQYLVYSVGPDRVDDGGKGDASRAPYGPPDLVFTSRRPN